MLRVIGFLVLSAIAALAQEGARMDQVVQSYVSGKTFMGSVLVARGEQILLSKGYGSANLEWNIPNTPDTKFRIASLTKQFTAAAILLLEERGRLKTDDLVKKFVPDAPPAWDKITIFHLLTHTSGIPDVEEPADSAERKVAAVTPEALVARFRGKPLDFSPGEKWSYSNEGYFLLGYLIEKISGVSYEKFLQDNIFAPLGMKDSGYDSNAAIMLHRASGYTTGRNGTTNAEFTDMRTPFSAGGLYSTTEDLLRWEQGLFGGKLLSASSLAKMVTPFKNNYGFGLYARTVNGHKVISHGGGIPGFNTFLAYYPDDKLTVIPLGNLNGDSPDRIASRLGAVAHGETVTLPSERKEITLDPSALSRYAGAYQLPTGVNVIITLENNQLLQKLTNQPGSPIVPESPTKFFVRQRDMQIEFRAEDGAGRPRELLLTRDGRSMTATRLAGAEAKRLSDFARETAKRFKDQTPSAGAEAALRKLIEGVRSGRPDYSLTSAGFAVTLREELPQLQAMITKLGPVQSVSFKSVGPAGADFYEVRFLNGTLEYRILIGPEGQIESANGRAP